MTEPRRRRRSSIAGRIGVVLLLTLLGIVVGWRGVVDHLARSSPVQALAWAPTQPEALVARIGTSVTSAPDNREQTDLALALLAASPLDGRGFRGLAVALERAGNLAAAATAYRQAAVRAPRDVPTQVWLANAAIAAGRLPEALGRIDRILRVEPELMPHMRPVLEAAARSDDAWPMLADLLTARPPWRSALLEHFSRFGDNSAGLAPLFLRLQASGAGLDEPELRAWLDRLVRDRHYAAAYQLWARALPEDRRQSLDNVFNGEFAWPASGLGFDWRFDRVPGARIERAERWDKPDDSALRIAFHDHRVPFEHVRQLLFLGAGDYVLSGEAMTDGLRSERGLVWALRCADGGTRLAESEALRKRQPWRPFRVAFHVPDSGCGAQWLSLRLPARIAAEQQIGGVAWFDNVAVAPR
jgi:tetratricopeptide (TPR) repeat protein